MLDLLAGFVQELRAAGLPVSLTENLDAMEAVQHIPIEDREAFKYALAATLVKNNAHWRAFETVFEVYFSLRGPQYKLKEDADADELWREMQEQLRQGEGRAGAGGMESLTPEEIAQLLMQALMNGDQAMMRALARQAVSASPAWSRAGRSAARTTCTARCATSTSTRMLEKLMEASPRAGRRRADAAGGAARAGRVPEPHRAVQARRSRPRSAAGWSPTAASRRWPRRCASRCPRTSSSCTPRATRWQSLRKALYPLTRKLAARLARKRRHGRKGPLDFRSTVRHSLSYGGVPAEPKFKYPRPAKPELMVVADISGSVAAFARFTLMLVYAIQGQFSKVRSFVFIDGIDEVTEYFKGVEDITEAIHRVNTEADVVWVDGHSDYGHAFEVFWERYGKDVGPKTTCCCSATRGTTTTPPRAGS